LAKQWAVLYLSDAPLAIAPYRSTMSQAHVIPVMDRAKSVPRGDIRYIVTDRNDSAPSRVTGAARVWDGQAYSLWKIDSPDWTVNSVGVDKVVVAFPAVATSGVTTSP
jgi:hypothetical protein